MGPWVEEETKGYRTKNRGIGRERARCRVWQEKKPRREAKRIEREGKEGRTFEEDDPEGWKERDGCSCLSRLGPKACRGAVEGKDCIKEETVHRHGSLDQATKAGVSLIHRVFHFGCSVRSRSGPVYCARKRVFLCTRRAGRIGDLLLRWRRERPSFQSGHLLARVLSCRRMLF